MASLHEPDPVCAAIFHHFFFLILQDSCTDVKSSAPQFTTPSTQSIAPQVPCISSTTHFETLPLLPKQWAKWMISPVATASCLINKPLTRCSNLRPLQYRCPMQISGHPEYIQVQTCPQDLNQTYDALASTPELQYRCGGSAKTVTLTQFRILTYIQIGASPSC